MREHITKGQFINGTLWKLLETIMSIGVTFVVSLILARLLSADDFGVIALAGVFINFSEILLQSAFSAPLIQKENIEDSDYTSVMLFSMVMAGGLYLITYIVAPLFAQVYKNAALEGVLRVIAVIFIFQAIGSVRTAMISRRMKFKLLSLCTAIAAITSGAAGIVMAIAGFGVWALVAQKILYQAVLNIVLFIVIKWKPTLKGASFRRVKELMSFGTKVLASSFISYVSDSSVSIVTGKSYSVSALGYSTKGVQYPCDISISTFQAVSMALFPTLASYQNSRESQKQIMRKVVSVVAFLLFPMMMGLFAVSKPFIIFLLTEKWLKSTPFMMAACIYYCATPMMLINVQLYHSLGDGKARVRFELVKLILTLATLLGGTIVLKLSLETVFIIRTGIELLIAALSVPGLKKAIDYSPREYMSDIIIPLCQAIIMGIIIYFVGVILELSNTKELLIQVAAGACIYYTLSVAIKPQGYTEMMKIIKERFKHA